MRDVRYRAKGERAACALVFLASGGAAKRKAEELLTRDGLLGTSLQRVTYSAVLEASNSSRKRIEVFFAVIFNAKARSSD
ncbi:unnamed protein product [Ilex paraguariensis]|uniref:Uncharacterized protein n=1 Tax=Ilex paraguariensis TaxID=185542 RepID=A0ABC8UL69_9AQUA